MSEADADAGIKAIRDEALRRIGCNVVLFQELEKVLKFLASTQHPSMPLSKAKATREDRVESIRTRTLGQVAGQVGEELFAAAHTESSAPAEITEPWLSVSFRIGTDPADLEESRNTLRALIRERNDLVHHLLRRWNLRDAESCSALCAELDEQRSRIILEIERCRVYANTVAEAARELQAFVDSEDGKRHFDVMYLQSSRLAVLLTQIATTHAREDGWTLLSVAGKVLSGVVPEQLAKLKLEHGEGSLCKLVAAIDLFDLASENMPKGGTRAIYRKRK